MQFDTFAEFMQMGGHGIYVWLVYGLGLLVLVGNIIVPLLDRKRFIREQRARRERELV